MTIDEPADYQLLKLIEEKLRDSNGMFSVNEVISLLKQEPELIELNKHVRAKELQDG